MADAPQMLLHCLGGRPAPAELAPALRKIDGLPEAAKEAFGELVSSTLELMPDDQLDNRIVRLCRKLGVDPEAAAPPIKSTRFLMRNAASVDADGQQLLEDLTALCGPDSIAATVLLPLYEKARPQLRNEVLQGALRAHGNVLMGMEWRIDTIGATNLGRVNAPIALITMHYQDRQQTGSFTVQMSPDMIAQLRDMCDELLQN